MEIPVTQLPPGDPRLVEAIVGQLKSKGIFDQFRKECLSDVDTKPAFQNLRQRVEGHVNKFLETKTWKNDMNKNQLRDGVRKHVNSLGILDSGIDAIITQVVNPKIKPLILPYVEDTVYAFLQIDKPKREKQDKIKEAPEEPTILFQIPEPTPDIKPSLLPMETDVISSEEDDILARESPESNHKSSPPSESNFIKEEDEDAQDGFESYPPHVAETTEDSVVSQVERLHITQDTEEIKTPAPTSKPPLPLFNDQSLDSISSNSSGLTFSTLSGKGSPGSKKSIDIMEKSEGSPEVLQESRSATSTPLVDEKPMDEEISQSSLESEITKDYPTSDAKYVEPMSKYVDASATTESQSTVGGDKDDQAYAAESISMQGDDSQESKGSNSKISTSSEKSEGEEKVKSEKSEGEISSSSPEVSDSENKGRPPEHHRSEDKHSIDPSNKLRKSKSDHKSKRDSHSREREREREKERDGKRYKDKERKHSKPRDDHHSHRDKDKKYHRRDKDHDGDRDRPRSHHTSTRDGSGSGSGSSSSKGSGDREKDRSSHHSSDKSASHHSSDKSAEGKSRRDKSSSKGGSKSNDPEEKPEGSPSECTDNKNGNKSEVRSDKNYAKPSSKLESKSDKGDNKSNSKSESKIEKTEIKSNSKSEGKSEKKLDGKTHSERSDRKHDTHSSKHSSKHKKEGEKSSSNKHKTSSKDDRKRKEDRDDKKEKGLQSKHSKIDRDSKSDKDERESKRSKDLKEKSTKEDPKLEKGIKPNVKENKQSPKESEASNDTDDQDKELSVAKSDAKQSPKESEASSDTDDQDKELSVVESDAKEEKEKQSLKEGKTGSDVDAHDEMPSIKSRAKNKKRKLKEVKPGSDVEGKDERPTLRTSARERKTILDEGKDASDSSKPDKRQTLRTQVRLNKQSLKEVETDSDVDDQDEMVPIKAYAKGKKHNLKEVKSDSDLDKGDKWLPNKKVSLPKKKQNKNGRTSKISDTADLQSLGIGDDSLVLMNEDGNLLVFTYEDDAAVPSTSSSGPSSSSSSPQREPEVDESQHDEISPLISEPKKRKHVEECENNNIDKRNVYDFEGFDTQTLDTRLADYLQTAKRIPDEMDMEFAEWLDESDLHMDVSESNFENEVEFRVFLSYMRKLGAVVCPPAGEKKRQAGSEVPQKQPLAKRRRASTSSSASSSTSQSGSPQHRRTTRARWNNSIQAKIQEQTNGRVDSTDLMEQHPVTPAGYLLTPEDDGNRTSSRDYEVDYSQRISTYSPLSPASDSSADDGKPKTGDSTSSVDSVAERTTPMKSTSEVFKSASTWSSDGNISV